MNESKSTWVKPALEELGDLNHVNQRISGLQKRISELIKNNSEAPTPENSEALAVYTEELKRLQEKYPVLLSCKDCVTPLDLTFIELSQPDLVDLRDCIEAGILHSRISKYPDDINRFQKVYKKIYTQVATQKNLS